MHREQEEYADEPTGQGPETRQQHRKMKMNRSGLSLTQEQKFDLIDFIHQRPHIWDQNSEGYRSNQSRQAAFNEVAQLLSNNEEVITRIQVQEEWGKLRYCFTRIVKKLLEEAPDGQITEEQLASISWAFFRRMDFLLDSVLQQLHGPGQQQAMGMDGDADWAAASLLHQQENMHSFAEHSPLRTKIRRRRRHHNNHNANGEINELSRKSSHEFGAEEMADDGNSIIGIDNQLLNQSTNELLMRQVLGLNAPELLVANALSSSQQLIHQLQQTEAAVEAKNAMDGGSKEGGEKSFAALMNSAIIQQQQQREHEQQMPMPSRTLRRKRKGSNLDFLLDTVAQQHQTEHCQQQRQPPPLPMAASTPSKQSAMNQTIASDLSMEGMQIGESSIGDQMQKFDGLDEHIDGTLALATSTANGGDEFGGNNGGGKSQAGGDIIDSFGRYIVQQLRAVHSKSPMLSLELRKELANLCFDYELRAFKKMEATEKDDDNNSAN